MIAACAMLGKTDAYAKPPLVQVWTDLENGYPPLEEVIIDRGGYPKAGDGPVFIEHRTTSYTCYCTGDITLWGHNVPRTDVSPELIISSCGFEDPTQIFGPTKRCYCFAVVTSEYVILGNHYHKTYYDQRSLVEAQVLFSSDEPRFTAFPCRGLPSIASTTQLTDEEAVAYMDKYVREHYETLKHSRASNCTCYSVSGVRLVDVIHRQINRNFYNYWLARVHRVPGGGNLVDQSGFTEAYYNAFDKLPGIQANTFANIIECITTIRSFKSGYKAFSSLKELAQDAWLAYRYQYKTTVSDLTELTNLLIRLDGLTSSNIRSYGTARRGCTTYKAVLTVAVRDVLPSSIREECAFLGVKLTAANIWDMIPYSFIVDWFLQVSAVCEALDQWGESLNFPIKELWYSFYTTDADDPSVSAYGRWKGEKPVLPHVTYKSASDRTITMRIADTASLFL